MTQHNIMLKHNIMLHHTVIRYTQSTHYRTNQEHGDFNVTAIRMTHNNKSYSVNTGPLTSDQS